jgi:hypothetical protein
VPLELSALGSVFIVLWERRENGGLARLRDTEVETSAIDGSWFVSFERRSTQQKLTAGGVRLLAFNLFDWATHEDEPIRHFSGTAAYTTTFTWDASDGPPRRAWIDLGRVAYLAEVRVNGVSCGVAWTPPYRVDVTQALRAGENQLTIVVANTWRNRLVGDLRLPDGERSTWTTAPALRGDAELLEAGLLGPVKLVLE